MRDGLMMSNQFAGVVMKVQIALLATIGFSLAMAPQLVPVLLGLCGVVSAACLAAVQRARLRPLIHQPLVSALLVFSAYLFVNATWAINPSAAFGKAVTVALLVVAGIATAAYFSALEKQQARILSRALIAGLAIGVTLLLSGLVFGQPVRILFHTLAPYLTGDITKDVVIQDGVITFVQPYRVNRNVANMVIFLMPVALLVHGIFSGAGRAVALILWIAAIVIATLLSQSDTAKLALAAGALVFTLAHVSAKAVRWGLVAAWIAALALAVPLGALPHKLDWHEVTWMPERSVAARFYIWRYTAEKITERPFRGIGLRGTRELQPALGEQRDLGAADRYRLRPGRHAHNGYLQIWLELGAIGAGLVLIVGLLGLQLIARWPPLLMQTGLAVFAMLAIVAATGWGIWQSWMLAGTVLVWPLLSLTHRVLESRSVGTSSWK